VASCAAGHFAGGRFDALAWGSGRAISELYHLGAGRQRTWRLPLTAWCRTIRTDFLVPAATRDATAGGL